MILDDFRDVGNFNIIITNDFIREDKVGDANWYEKTIRINEVFLSKNKEYKKGNGSLVWHSTHEISHLMENRIKKAKLAKGVYGFLSYLEDLNTSAYTGRTILQNATINANKKNKWNLTTKDYLSNISDYALKNKYNSFNFDEGVSESIGRYYQIKSKENYFKGEVYKEFKKMYNEFVLNK